MIFNNPVRPSPFIIEAIVYEVDVKREVCKCRTYGGQVMSAVSWSQSSGGSGRSGIITSPRVGDRVIISTHTGAPIIIGCKPIIYEHSLGTSNRLIELPEVIDSVDTGNSSFMSDSTLRINASRPPESVIGDHILSSDGGAVVGALKGGSVLLKTSPLSQIFLSKTDDLYRIVARNQERFSDAHTDVVANIANRQYRFLGFSDTIKNVREDRYKYFEIYGDTEAGEFLKGKYHTIEASSIPERGEVLRTNVVAEYPSVGTDGYQDPYNDLYRSQLFLSGSKTEIVRTGDGITEAAITHHNGQILTEVHDDAEDSFIDVLPGSITRRVNGNGGYSEILSNGASNVLDWNGQATITENASGITIDWKGQGTITITDSGIKSDWKGRGLIDITDSSITCDWNGSSKTILNDSSATIESGGHKVEVSSSGIAMS